ncbi:anhydro-N-acetylmuramic acid kinase [Serratia marcescens]|uniref:anhydro-N-acetylmuramic acid kinase n=1 Tax=Serratia marcescens TaxID=615 RepID=UPI00313F26F9
MEKELYVGLMSGTSLDGIDAVIMDFSESKPRLVASGFTPMPEDLRKAVGDLCRQGHITLSELGELDHRLGKLYASSVNELLSSENIPASSVRAVGCHGQTVWHSPGGDNPFTMQIGDANLIAALSGITTVADFRRKDMAFGGQGAPLVPAFHQALFERDDRLTVVLNIGGVSNISVLQTGKAPLGYDTGPGNLLLDAWTEKHLGKPYDQDAAWASQGSVSAPLLHHLLDESYFSRPAPKSTGRELFSLAWLEQKLKNFPTVSSQDVQATLVELTAETISQELLKLSDHSLPAVLMLCGGGARNPLLVSRLRSLLPAWTTGITTDAGLNIDYVEAAAFAWLAHQRITNQPGNVPAVTGASKAVSLGAIYPAENFN